MSADNAIFYREIDGLWYMMHGFESDCRTDEDYKTNRPGYSSLGTCLQHAHAHAQTYTVLEYGIVHDPAEPEAPRGDPEIKTCVTCEHLCMDRGIAGYSEDDPGKPWSLYCEQDHWANDAWDYQSELEDVRLAFCSAENCEDYTKVDLVELRRRVFGEEKA